MAWLTKSNYLFGLQCPRLLWVAKNDKGGISELDYSAKHTFEVGEDFFDGINLK